MRIVVDTPAFDLLLRIPSMIAAVTAYGQIDTRSQYGGTAAAVVDETGNLRVAADYQTAYQMLGSWAVAADDGPGSKEMHVVYASPGTIAAYRKDGHFPDDGLSVLLRAGVTVRLDLHSRLSGPDPISGAWRR